MSCKACDEAEREPRRDVFANGCISCDARALALVAGSTTQDTLAKVFGQQHEQGLRLVREWAGKIRQARAQ